MTGNLGRLLIGLLMVVLGLVASACGRGPEESGSNVIGLQAENTPLVTIRIGFQVGSINDPTDKKGLNAITALMIGRGGTASMTYEEIAEVLYPWSASISVQFDKEMTVVVGEVHRDHLEPFTAIMRDLVAEPRFDTADFARNREFLTNSVVSSLRGNNDEELGKESLNALMYEGHPYGFPVIGTEHGLSSVSVDDVQSFHAAHYTRGKAIIGVAGGYPDGFAQRLDEEFFGTFESQAVAGAQAVLPDPRTLNGFEILIVDKDAIATAISIGFPIDVTRADDDFYALMVANSYFGEHRTFNGLLMNKMRGQRGLNYGDYSYIENFIQDGGSRLPVPNIPRRQQFFSIWIRPVPHHNAHFALRQAIRELQVLVDEGIAPEDFEASRDFLLNYSKLYVQTTSRRLGYHMDSAFYGSSFFIDEIQRRLSELTVDDVNAAIRKYLGYDNLAIAVVTSDAEAFRDKLLSNQPSPPTYNAEVTADILAEDELIVSLALPVQPDGIRVVPVEQMFRD